MTVYRIILSSNKKKALIHWLNRLAELGVIGDCYINEYPDSLGVIDG